MSSFVYRVLYIQQLTKNCGDRIKSILPTFYDQTALLIFPVYKLHTFNLYFSIFSLTTLICNLVALTFTCWGTGSLTICIHQVDGRGSSAAILTTLIDIKTRKSWQSTAAAVGEYSIFKKKLSFTEA